MSLELCHPASLRRVADWRWRAATCLLTGRFPAHPAWSDPWVERAVAFREALDGSGGDSHHPRLVEPDQVLASAHQIRSDRDRPLRWHVEALLLAGEGGGSVAGRCGGTAGALAIPV